jgi:hypothetical protein
MTVSQFNKAFVDCMVEAHEEFGRRGMDVAQYEAEKKFWDLRCNLYLSPFFSKPKLTSRTGKKAERFDDVVKRCYSSVFPLRDPEFEADYSPNLKQEAKKVVRKASKLFRTQAKGEALNGEGDTDFAGLWKRILRTPSVQSCPELLSSGITKR